MSDARVEEKEKKSEEVVVRAKLASLVTVPITKTTLGIIKPQNDAASQKQVKKYRDNMITPGTVSLITINDTVSAHVLRRDAAQKVEKNKAIIFLYSSKNHVAKSLHTENALIHFLSQIHTEVNLHFIGLDYPANGLNQSDPKKFFTDVAPCEDIAVVSALIRKVLDDKRLKIKPSDIYVLAESYGVSIALSSLHDLQKQYSGIKLIAHNGPNDDLIKSTIRDKIHDKDQDKAIDALKKDGVLPTYSFDEMLKSDGIYPYCFAFQTRGDKMLLSSQTFAHSCSMIKSMTGRVLHLELHPEASDDAHYASYESLQLKLQNVVIDAHVLYAAIISGKSLKLIFNCAPLKIAKASLKLHKDDKPIEMPQLLPQITEKSSSDCIFISPINKMFNDIIETLYTYCISLEKDAFASGKGGDYKRGKGKDSDWNARQKINAAIKILSLLLTKDGPDVEGINKLNSDVDFNKYAGSLRTEIFDKQVMKFIEIMQECSLWISKFNNEIIAISQQHLISEKKSNLPAFAGSIHTLHPAVNNDKSSSSNSEVINSNTHSFS